MQNWESIILDLSQVRLRSFRINVKKRFKNTDGAVNETSQMNVLKLDGKLDSFSGKWVQLF